MFTKHVSEWATNLRAAIKTSIVVAIGKVVPHDKIFRFLYLLLIQYCLLQFLNDSPPYFAVEENTDDTTHSRQYIVLGCWKDCSSSHFRPTIMRVSRSDSPKDSLKDKYNNCINQILKSPPPRLNHNVVVQIKLILLCKCCFVQICWTQVKYCCLCKFANLRLYVYSALLSKQHSYCTVLRCSLAMFQPCGRPLKVYLSCVSRHLQIGGYNRGESWLADGNRLTKG